MHGSRGGPKRQKAASRKSNNTKPTTRTQKPSSTTSSPTLHPLTTTPSAPLTTSIHSPLTRLQQQHHQSQQQRGFAVKRNKHNNGGQKAPRKGSNNHHNNMHHQQMDMDDFASMLFSMDGGHGGMPGMKGGKKGRNNNRQHDNPFTEHLVGSLNGSGYDNPAFHRANGVRGGRKPRGVAQVHDLDSDDLAMLFGDGMVMGDHMGMDYDSSDDMPQRGPRGKQRQGSHYEMFAGDDETSEDYSNHHQQQQQRSGGKKSHQKGRGNSPNTGPHDSMEDVLFNMFGGDPSMFGFEEMHDNRDEKRQRRQQEKELNSQRIMKTSDGVEVFDDHSKIQKAMSGAEVREAHVVDSSYTEASYTSTNGSTATPGKININMKNVKEAQFESVSDYNDRQRQEVEWKATYEAGSARASADYDQRVARGKKHLAAFYDENGNAIELTSQERQEIKSKIRRGVVEDPELSATKIKHDAHGNATFTRLDDGEKTFKYTGNKDEQFEQMRRQIEEANEQFARAQEKHQFEALERDNMINPNAHSTQERIKRAQQGKHTANTASAMLNDMLGDIAEIGAEHQRAIDDDHAVHNFTKENITSIKMAPIHASIESKEGGYADRKGYSKNNAVNEKGEAVKILDDDLNTQLNKMNNSFDNASGAVYNLHAMMLDYKAHSEKMKAKGIDIEPFNVSRAMKEVKKHMMINTSETPAERQVLREFANLTKHAYGFNTEMEDEMAEKLDKVNSVMTAEDIAHNIRDTIFSSTKPLSITHLTNTIQEQYQIVRRALKDRKLNGELSEKDYLFKRAELEDLMVQREDLVKLFLSQRFNIPISELPSLYPNQGPMDPQELEESKAQMKEMEEVANTAINRHNSVGKTPQELHKTKKNLESLLRQNKQSSSNNNDQGNNDYRFADKEHVGKYGIDHFHDDQVDRLKRQKTKGKKNANSKFQDLDINFKQVMNSDSSIDEDMMNDFLEQMEAEGDGKAPQQSRRAVKRGSKRTKNSNSDDEYDPSMDNMMKHLFHQESAATSNRTAQRARKDESQRLHETYRPTRRFSTLVNNSFSPLTQFSSNLATSVKSALFTQSARLYSTHNRHNIHLYAKQQQQHNYFNNNDNISPFDKHSSSLLSLTKRHFSTENKPKKGRVADLLDHQPFEKTNIRLDSLLASPSHRQKQLSPNSDELKPTVSRKQQQFKKLEKENEKQKQKVESAKASALKTSMSNLGDKSHAKKFAQSQLGKINKSNTAAGLPEEIFAVPTKQGRKALRDARLKDAGLYHEKHSNKKTKNLPAKVTRAIRESAIKGDDGTTMSFKLTANGNVLLKKKHMTGIQRARAVSQEIQSRNRDYLGALNGRYPTNAKEASSLSPNVRRSKFPVWMADMDNDPYMLNEHWSEVEEDDNSVNIDPQPTANGVPDPNQMSTHFLKANQRIPQKLHGFENDLEGHSDEDEYHNLDDSQKADRAFSLSKREENRIIGSSLRQEFGSLGLGEDIDIDLDIGPLRQFKTDPMTLVQGRRIDMIPEEDDTRFEVLYAKEFIKCQVNEEMMKGSPESNPLGLELDDADATIPSTKSSNKNDKKNKKNKNVPLQNQNDDEIDQLLADDTNDNLADDGSAGETAGESEIERALERLLAKSSNLGIDTTDTTNAPALKQQIHHSDSEDNDTNGDNNSEGDGDKEDKPLTKRQLIAKIAQERFENAMEVYKNKNMFKRASGFTSYEDQLAAFEKELENQKIDAKIEAGMDYISELDDDSEFVDDDERELKRKYRYGNNKGISDDENDDNMTSEDSPVDTNNIYLPKRYMDLHKKGLYTQKSARRKSQDQLVEESRAHAEWNRDTDEFYQQTELLQMKGFDIEDPEQQRSLSRRLDRYQDISSKFKPGRAPETPLLNKSLQEEYQKQHHTNQTNDFHNDDDNVENDNQDDEEYDSRFDDIESDAWTDEEDDLLNELAGPDSDVEFNPENPSHYDELGFPKSEFANKQPNRNKSALGTPLQPHTTFTTQKNRKDRKNIVDLEQLALDLGGDHNDLEDDEEASYVHGHAVANRQAGTAKPQAVAKIIGGEQFFTFELHEEDLDEHFVRGSGPGGQSVNKTKNCVVLQHKPTSTVVKCSQTRELHRNRAIARKIMRRKLEALFKGKDSYLGRKIERLQKKKQKAARRQKSSEKYSVKRDEEIVRLRAKLGLDITNTGDQTDGDDGNVEIVKSALSQQINPDIANSKTKM